VVTVYSPLLALRRSTAPWREYSPIQKIAALMLLIVTTDHRLRPHFVARLTFAPFVRSIVRSHG
jgi:hypothetical protein